MRILVTSLIAACVIAVIYYASFYLWGWSAVSKSINEAQKAGLLVARYRLAEAGKDEAFAFSEVWIERQSHWERRGLLIRRLPDVGFRLVVTLNASPSERVHLRMPGSSHTMSMLSGGRWHYEDIESVPPARFQLQMQDYAAAENDAGLFTFELEGASQP